MNSLIGHPDRLRLWLGLPAMSVRALTRWRIADGARVNAIHAHQHAVPTLVISLRGMACVEGKQRLDLGPGDVLAIGTGCWHWHAPIKRDAVCFGLGFYRDICDVRLEGRDWCFHGFMSGAAIRCGVDRILAGDHGVVPQVLEQVIAGRLMPHPANHPAVERMFLALWQGMHLGVTAESVVKAAGIPRRTAFTLFRRAFGTTPRRMTEEFRLDIARALLEEGASVGNAATQVGFSTRDRLGRAWRRRMGDRPSQRRPVGNRGESPDH